MANYYSNETPSGTINGVNKTFTTANPINTIIYVIVDGLTYSGTITYTVDTYEFTLADAPSTSIVVAYYDGATGVSISGGVSVTSLRDEYELRKGDISDVDTDVFVQWCDIINKYLYNQLKGQNTGLFASTGTYTVSEAPSSQALPTDFKDMNPLACGVYEVDSDGEVTEYKLPYTGYGSRQKGFYFDDGNIVFTGIDDGSQYKLRYLPLLSTLTSLSSTMIVTLDKKQYLLDALEVCYTIWDDDPNAEMSADQRFVRSLADIVQNFNPTPLAYGLGDSTQNF